MLSIKHLLHQIFYSGLIATDPKKIQFSDLHGLLKWNAFAIFHSLMKSSHIRVLNLFFSRTAILVLKKCIWPSTLETWIWILHLWFVEGFFSSPEHLLWIDAYKNKNEFTLSASVINQNYLLNLSFE